MPLPAAISADQVAADELKQKEEERKKRETGDGAMPATSINIEDEDGDNGGQDDRSMHSQSTFRIPSDHPPVME